MFCATYILTTHLQESCVLLGGIDLLYRRDYFLTVEHLLALSFFFLFGRLGWGKYEVMSSLRRGFLCECDSDMKEEAYFLPDL